MKKLIEDIVQSEESPGDRAEAITKQNELFMEAIVWVALLSLGILA